MAGAVSFLELSPWPHAQHIIGAPVLRRYSSRLDEYPYLIAEAAGAQRGSVTCLESHSSERRGWWGLEPRHKSIKETKSEPVFRAIGQGASAHIVEVRRSHPCFEMSKPTLLVGLL